MMDKFISENLHTSVIGEYEVLIAGGGVAGVAAALAAARQGAKVGLLEREYMLGGLATAGLIAIYLPLCDGMGKQVSFGIAEELLKLSIRYGCEGELPTAWLEGADGAGEGRAVHSAAKTDPGAAAERRYDARFNPQLFAIAAEQLLVKNGVSIHYGTAVCGVKMEENRISHVIAENKSGRVAWRVKSVVDATGDSDLCRMAGEKTALFGQQNVLAAWYYYVGKNGYGLKTLGIADVPEEEKSGEISLLTKRRFQGITEEELSEMMRLSHGVILEDLLDMRKMDPECFPVTIATIPQVRMTRRICGRYVLDTSEERVPFADSIGAVGNWKRRGPAYEIPYRCLYGETVKNLITAGRSISVTDAMWDVTRVIPACAVTGQAAGTAAALTDCFAALDVGLLQRRLRVDGVKLHLQARGPQEG